MKLPVLLILCLAALKPLVAIDFGGLKERAAAAIPSASSNYLELGNRLLTSFKGNTEAMNAAKGLLQSFKEEEYLKAFDYYDKIKAAELTPAQLSTWNDVKNSLSAIILDSKFNFTDSGMADLVSKAAHALQSNDTAGAGNYLKQLKDAASLSGGQLALLNEIQSHLGKLRASAG